MQVPGAVQKRTANGLDWAGSAGSGERRADAGSLTVKVESRKCRQAGCSG